MKKLTTAKVVLAVIAVVLAVSFGVNGAWTATNSCAGETPLGKQKARKGPLAGLPSAPGGHIEKLKALGNNKWLNLGAPAPDPKRGRAFGRAWGAKAFALAPEIRGAYFTGEGAHAGVKPDGYGLDDYWVYDINAHRWICIYPGTNTKTFNQDVKDGKIRVNKHGQVVDKEGRPIPGHLLIHAWGFLAYDTHRKKFTMCRDTPGFYRYFMPGGKKLISEGLTLLEKQGLKERERDNPPHTPWSYDTMTGRFERHPTAERIPKVGGYPQFLYISRQKKFFYAGVGRGIAHVAFYDPEKRSWSRPKTKGKGPTTGSDWGACYDAKRDRVYMGGPDSNRLKKKLFFIYDVQTHTWTAPKSKGTYPLKFGTYYAAVHYDVANDVVLIMHFKEKKIYAYHPDADKWDDPIPMPLPESRKCYNAFYDQKLNIHFVYAAGDSRDNGIMWAYRYAKKK